MKKDIVSMAPIQKLILVSMLALACLSASHAIARANDFDWEDLQSQRQILATLKGDDPAAFEQKMKQRRLNIQAKLKTLRQENPEKFKEIMKRRRERFKKKMEKLQVENPGEYERMQAEWGDRREKRLQRMKNNNPAKYQKLMHVWKEYGFDESINSRAQWIQRMKIDNPESYKRMQGAVKKQKLMHHDKPMKHRKAPQSE